LQLTFYREICIMKTLEEVKKEHIRQVLDYTNWDIKKASKILKVSEVFLEKEIQKMGNLELADRKISKRIIH
jgi:hypothetical protein